ncbi:deoxyribodipyrimidine photo-lyase [Capronia epimyces CBS 606.96]|uniref:Deoxyribodipyrimidine photo-lyase n=1 Tax=Capronia epimyces CBS 606.96 TaxID=1182542 RepID=W9XHM6_9EURO|nr:deoxyribodipyrimidine photo-lyase [Capronia epimyces CBS 606.96]EXJ76835.1 deoxyribodipyrimidine photo-lyase [Capronia epimyces CBS 606.96]
MTTAPKRKADVSFLTSERKRLHDMLPGSTSPTNETKYDVLLRKYYPLEITNRRANEYSSGYRERPIEALERALLETQAQRDRVSAAESVVHWFKCDIRITDNKGLYLASAEAEKHRIPLICMYLISPQDFEAHLTAPVRVDFILRNLRVLKHDLAQLKIPLHVEVVDKRRSIPSRLMELCNIWGAKHVFCNIEYEVDELRRETALVRACSGQGISFSAIADRCVVEPGRLTNSSGAPLRVYSPWHRRWCAYLNQHPSELDPFPVPKMNPANTGDTYPDLFRCEIPQAPRSKWLSEQDRAKFSVMWPAGEHEARDRLSRFLQERADEYQNARNIPSANGTSVLSPHLAAGTLAARTVVREAREASPNQKLTDDRKQGHSRWIGELAFRDFYTSILCYWPYICMNKPLKLEYSNIEWEDNMDHFKKWTDGRTGFPIVDAAMRQLAHTGYMHNRCRMMAASFLAKDLLIDWRMGEKWFMEHLIDGDFASNNGGWGFSASCGADPQPYFRIFNPLLQSDKFDAQGDYIRKWVPELADIQDRKGIHDPYGQGYARVAETNGYPKPMVDHQQSRERALLRYKAGLGRSTA